MHRLPETSNGNGSHKALSVAGVLPTPTGSEVNRLSRDDGLEINNGNMEEFLSSRGIEYIQRVIANSVEAGCTIGTTSTFRVTPFRPKDSGSWEIPKQKIFLPEQFEHWNRILVEIARKAFGKLPLLGNICPITNTSPSDDDKHYAAVGGGSQAARIELARCLHDPQIRVLAESRIDGILVEACRHPDDALGIAQSVREHKIPLLIVSFEAEEHGLPDPIHCRSDYGFAGFNSDLQVEAGQSTTTSVGVNCIGASRIHNFFEAGVSLDIVYPNQRDDGRAPPHLINSLSAVLNESSKATLFEDIGKILEHHTPCSLIEQVRVIVNEGPPEDIRNRLRGALDKAADTPMPELEKVWKRSLETRAQIIGICCGGRPEHVEAASRVWRSRNNSL
jgi:S-methylmethionine-dependent homocysteine/selenocysteine methylase